MRERTLTLLFCLAAAFTLFSAHVTHAQFILEDESISIRKIPTYPGPGEQVTLNIVGNNVDTNRTDFTWKKSGEIIAEGVGVHSIVTTVPFSGESIITVSGKTDSLSSVSTKVNLMGSFVDLVWESEGFPIPFYKGRIPLLPQARAKVVAMPQVIDGAGKSIPASQLYYTWKFNNIVQTSKSGYGKSVFYNDLSQRSNTISVSVSDIKGSTLASSQTTLMRQAPELLIYREHPFYGVLYTAAYLGNLALSDNEIVLRAEPLGYSILNIFDGDIAINWQINGKKTEAIDKFKLGIAAKTGEIGVISATAVHSIARFQQALTTMKIRF